jgi:hypothetical protein
MFHFRSYVAVSVREFSSEIPASHTGYGLNGLCFKTASKEFRKIIIIQRHLYIYRLRHELKIEITSAA